MDFFASKSLIFFSPNEKVKIETLRFRGFCLSDNRLFSRKEICQNKCPLTDGWSHNSFSKSDPEFWSGNDEACDEFEAFSTFSSLNSFSVNSTLASKKCSSFFSALLSSIFHVESWDETQQRLLRVGQNSRALFYAYHIPGRVQWVELSRKWARKQV